MVNFCFCFRCSILQINRTSDYVASRNTTNIQDILWIVGKLNFLGTVFVLYNSNDFHLSFWYIKSSQELNLCHELNVILSICFESSDQHFHFSPHLSLPHLHHRFHFHSHCLLVHLDLKLETVIGVIKLEKLKKLLFQEIIRTDKNRSQYIITSKGM